MLRHNRGRNQSSPGTPALNRAPVWHPETVHSHHADTCEDGPAKAANGSRKHGEDFKRDHRSGCIREVHRSLPWVTVTSARDARADPRILNLCLRFY